MTQRNHEDEQTNEFVFDLSAMTAAIHHDHQRHPHADPSSIHARIVQGNDEQKEDEDDHDECSVSLAARSHAYRYDESCSARENEMKKIAGHLRKSTSTSRPAPMLAVRRGSNESSITADSFDLPTVCTRSRRSSRYRSQEQSHCTEGTSIGKDVLVPFEGEQEVLVEQEEVSKQGAKFSTANTSNNSTFILKAAPRRLSISNCAA